MSTTSARMTRRCRAALLQHVVLTILLVLPLSARGQDFDFEEVDNRIHALGNRPDTFQLWRPFGPVDCKEESIEKREQYAQVIFTGTVRRLYDDYMNVGLYKAQVEIKRILKGSDIINRLPGVYPETNDIYYPWTRRLVIINGIGDPKICRSLVRKYDTRIFMTTEVKGHRELKLNSSLIRLTLDNIEHTVAAIRGAQYKPKPTEAPIDPCERVFCAFGARCVVDTDTNTGKCKCIEKCSALFSPVCGSDGTSYSSECHLRRASCSEQKRILVVYQGSCNDNVKDPCATMKCSFGAQCMASYDGLTARCQCIEHCDNYGDSVGSTPVCGTDGKDYPNECEMKRAACHEMIDIEVKYPGKCDPCNGHVCDRYHVCQLDNKRRPQCRCNDRCPMELSPVCGSDGKTYSSQCHLEVEACRTRRIVEVRHHGDCRLGPNPCARLRCSYGEECHVDRSGEARCICPPSCEPVQKPVCGSDGMTYDNECELHRQACLSKTIVTVSQRGRCDINSPCADYQCDFGAVCAVIDNKASCQCPSCGKEYSPVCGSDNVTYNNECELRAAGCIRQQKISIQKKGPCIDVCSGVKCNFYGICEDDGFGNPTCVCSTYCVEMDKPVCGTDGVTYANECQLKVASCQKQQFIMVASEGHCDRCQNVKCKFGSRCENGRCVCPSACSLEYDPVCASNHKTYDNECRMMMDACNQQIELSVEYSGECEEFSGSGESSDDDVECNETNCRFGGICEFEISGTTKCNCDFNCDAIRDTVCGSDGNTYGSVCLLREQSCKLQKDIHVVDMDYCGEIIEEPCDGAPVEINPLTGEEFVCSKNGDQSCPANSYCHIIEGQQLGRCCKQDEQPIRSCRETEFGCCPDQRTAALGPKFAGCPSLCQCNPLGSQGTTCDPVTGQCSCKPGVGGLRCDRCEPGYYGLPLIAANGNSGCIACNCNLYGSIRDDCEQMHGTCVCKPGIKGTRCDRCPDGQPIGPDGCSGQLSTTPEPMALRELESGDQHSARTCRELVCRFGAVCKMINGRPRCTCNEDCSHVRNVYKVCASNGETYSSECEMRRFGCRLQKHVHVVHKGECRKDSVITPRTPTRSHKTTRHVYSRLTSSDDMAATPSTPEYGWIGDICTEDSDCVARDSYCRNGLCACRDGLVPNGQKTICQGSTYTVPGFSGINSYLRLKKIEQAYRQVTIEMTFKALSNEGILLYSGKNMNGTGDFISLSVKDGFVEFRYDLGSGPAVLKSSHQVTMNKFHKLKVQRFMKEGILYLDDMYEASSVSPGKLNNLNLRTDTFLGWVPNAVKEIYDNIGTAMALSGCIESLSIQNGEGGHVYDLIAPESADVIEAEAITECGSSACASMPCLNGGSCMSADPEKFTCKCPPGYKGVKCEIGLHDEESEMCRDQTYCLNGGTCYDVPSFGELRYCKCPPEFSGPRCATASPAADITVDIPQFHGDSYLELPLSVDPSKSIAVEIWFLPLKENGVLFYIQQDNHQLSYYSGDFMSLNLVNGHLQLRYNLGSGSANITSPTHLLLNVWHSVKISRKEKMAEMIIDENENISGISAGALTRLNVPNIIWIGGYPGDYNPLSGVTKGFTGAIQSVFIDGSQILNLYKSAKKHEHITNYNGPPCDVNNNPCLNNGQCVPKLNDYTCICTEDYAGKQCELTKMLIDTERPLAFDGITNQEYENRITHKDRSQRSNKFEIKFRTTSESGLLLLQHKTYTVEGDYLTLALREGYVEASYNLGKETPDKPLVIRSNVKVTDGKWHTVRFTRDRRKGSLSVDNEDAITGVSTDGATQLDTDGRIWIGGSYTPPRGLPKAYMQGFKGCIDLVLIEDEALDLVTDRKDNGPTQYCDLNVS